MKKVSCFEAKSIIRRGIKNFCRKYNSRRLNEGPIVYEVWEGYHQDDKEYLYYYFLIKPPKAATLIKADLEMLTTRLFNETKTVFATPTLSSNVDASEHEFMQRLVYRIVKRTRNRVERESRI